MVAASFTDHRTPGGRGRGFAPVLRWDMTLEQPACLPAAPGAQRYLHPSSHTHTPWTPSLIPSPTQLTRTTKIPPLFFHFRGERAVPFLLALCVEPAQELLGQALELVGGEQQPPPLLLAVCPQIRLGRIGNLSSGNQNTLTFPRTWIHLKLCSNNLHKQIYYAIYVMQH